jgi:hypothetical protein
MSALSESALKQIPKGTPLEAAETLAV